MFPLILHFKCDAECAPFVFTIRNAKIAHLNCSAIRMFIISFICKVHRIEFRANITFIQNWMPIYFKTFLMTLQCIKRFILVMLFQHDSIISNKQIHPDHLVRLLIWIVQKIRVKRARYDEVWTSCFSKKKTNQFLHNELSATVIPRKLVVSEIRTCLRMKFLKYKDSLWNYNFWGNTAFDLIK